MATYASNIVINSNEDFTQTFNLESSSNNSALNLTGYTILAQIRKHSSSSTAVSFATTSVAPTTGVLKLSLDPSDTTDLKPGRYVYDIVLTDTSSVKTRVVEGSVIVSKTVSR